MRDTQLAGYGARGCGMGLSILAFDGDNSRNFIGLIATGVAIVNPAP